MTRKMAIGLLAFALLMSGCRQTPAPSPGPQPSDPDPVPRGLSAVEGKLEGWTMG